METDLSERLAKMSSGEKDATIVRLIGERDEARAWVRRITAEERVLTCAFCEAARASLERQLGEVRAAGDALAARLEEGVAIVEGLVKSSRAGWESARLLAVAHGAHATERRAVEELAALPDAEGEVDEKNCPQCDTVTTEPVCPECGMPLVAGEPGDG